MRTRAYDALASALVWATVWVAMLSWRSFTADAGAYLGPAAILGLLIVAVGAIGRAFRLQDPVIVLMQIVIGGLATDIMVFGDPVPLSAGARHHVVDVFNTAYDAAAAGTPTKVGDGGIAPYLLLGAAAAFLFADVLVHRLHRPPLAGLVLLAILSVPLTVAGGGVAWWVFALTATGFVALLALQQAERVSHWGRQLNDSATAAIVADRPRRLTRICVAGPCAIGVTATAAALVLPIFVPTLHLDFSGWGPGSGGSGPIRVTNPTVGMYDDLKSRSDTPLVYVHVDGGADVVPSYLRIATLTSFNGNEWTPGGRSIPPDHRADTRFAPPENDGSLLGQRTSYTLTATHDFQSRWLPTFYYTTRIDAQGDWRYDDDTLDFISGDSSGGLDTAGETWTLTAAPVEPPEERLLSAPAGSGGLPAAYTALPALPPQIARIARQKTAAETTPFEKAVALQEWFHSSGEFRYSLDRPGGTGRNDLLHFVTDEKVGYCQQFATAMAAMARELGIPARVAVGFLNPTADGDGTYVFRGRDMHAWPELWFDGVGWVRFEPTPAAADTTVPSYTVGVLGGHDTDPPGTPTTQDPTTAPAPLHQPIRPNPRSPQNRQDQTGAATPGNREHGHAGLVATASVCGILVLGAAGASLPLWARRRRRARRLRGGPEEGWAELRDTARDLGLPWSDTVSPRAMSLRLADVLHDQTAVSALDRLVVAVERSRYARSPSQEPVADDVRTVVETLLAEAPRAEHRRAILWPRSAFSSGHQRQSERPEQERELIDHMG